MPEDYIKRLKEIPVIQILQDIYGINPQKRGDKYYCKIRSERTGSCCIYPTNTWYDFGAGVGGDSINLVQTMESCDRKDAMQKLADYYNVTHDHRSRNDKSLWDHEWQFLGIYPDMVSKNLNISVVGKGEKFSRKADINLDPTDTAQIKAFEEKYRISMNEFRKADPVGYHSILKNHVLLPLFTEKEDYFSHLLCTYKLCKEIESDEFAKAAVSNDENFIRQSKDLNKKSVLLRRAVDDISLLKVPLFNLSPRQDLNDILSGKAAVNVSKVGYYDLCRLARKQKSKLSFAEISYDDYIKESVIDDSDLHKIPHSTVYKNGTCTMYFFQNYATQMREMFSDSELKIAQIPDNFSANLGKIKAKSSSKTFRVPE